NVTGTGDFLFRDDSTSLTLGPVGILGGITTNGGRVAVATTTSGGITLAAQGGITSGGGEIDISVAAGGTFTNSAIVSSAAAGGGGTIVILADAMTLSTGGIDPDMGTVVLGPRSTTNNIALGAASSAGTLGLQQSDLNSILATRMLQIG